MWYVVWTTTGSEPKLCSWISDYVSKSCYEVCFCPQVEQLKKIKGEWKTNYRALFPGYVVVKTDKESIRIFQEQISCYDGFAVILSNEGIISPIDCDDTFYIESAYANNGILGCSTGYIKGDKIHILSGPLKEKEGEIKYIDRHKRIAMLELVLFGRKLRISMGLEIISKEM